MYMTFLVTPPKIMQPIIQVFINFKRNVYRACFKMTYFRMVLFMVTGATVESRNVRVEPFQELVQTMVALRYLLPG